MDKSFVFWILTFIVGIASWFVLNLNRGDYNYSFFPNLRNKTTGKLIEMRGLANIRNLFDEPSEYINQTDSEERLYKLMHGVNIFSPFSNDQYYRDKREELISGGPVADQTKCGHQLGWLIGKLTEFPNYSQLKGQLGYELTRLMDTYGRYQPLTFRGDHISLGSYTHCLQSKLQDGKVQNRYCLARFSMKSWPKDPVVYPPVTMSYGICIPETCDTNSFGIHKNSLEFLAKYHFSQEQKDQLVFESLFCLPDERSDLRTMNPISYAVIGLIIGWLVMIIGASAFDEYYFRRKYKQNLVNNSAIEMMMQKQQQETFIGINNGEKLANNNDCNNNNIDNRHGDAKRSSIFEHLVEGLTIRHSIKVFKQCNFRVRYDRGERVRVDLSSIDFMKSMFIILIVLGHGYIFSAMFAKPMRGRIDLTTGDVSKTAISVGRFVDTFFVFFGLLSTYTILRKFNLKQLSNPIIWTMANIGIYLRIMPVFMLTYMFNRTIMPYTGSGPFWDYGVESLSLRSLCRHESWIKMIPPLGSFGLPPAPACNPPSWFLVSYSQIALLLPLLTYLLYRIPRTIYRVLLISFLIIVSALNVGYRLYVQRVVNSDLFTYYGGMMVTLLDKYENSGYMDTLTRLGSVTIGCVVGYLLHLYSIGRIQEWPRWMANRYFTLINLILHAIIYMLPVFAIRVYWYTGKMVSLESFVVGNMIAYSIWPILNGLLVLNVVTIHAKHVLVRFMSNPFWHIFNKLGLCILLVQYEIIMYSLRMFEYGPTNGFIMDAIKIGSFGLFFSVLISFVIYVFYEAPINHIVMLMLGPLMLGRARARLNEENNVTKTNFKDGITPASVNHDATKINQDSNNDINLSDTKDGVARIT